MVTVVLGASNDPYRYSNQAMSLLKELGIKAIPVHPREETVLGEKVWRNLRQLAESGQAIDTVTVYVNSELTTKLLPDFLALKPRRVIFNPGAENPDLQKKLQVAGVEVIEACTLVMLRTKQY